MNRVGITRDDWAKFTEISGYYKARGETLMAVSKLDGNTFRVALYHARPFVVREILDDNGNIISMERIAE